MTLGAPLPQPEIRAKGEVVYRCAGCGSAIDGNAVFFDGTLRVLPSALTPGTKTFHLEHAPDKKELTHGR